MGRDGRDERDDSPPPDRIDPLYREILRTIFFVMVTIGLIYIACETVVCVLHIQPTSDDGILLPALV